MTLVSEHSRRRFLKISLSGGLAAVSSLKLPAVARAQRGPTTAPVAPLPPARVALTAGDDRADNTLRALKAFAKEIAQAIGKKRVIVKPNNVVIDRPLCASHADQLEGFLDLLKSIGKTGDDVVIAESPAFGSVMEGFANYGYDRLARKYGVKLADLDQQGFDRPIWRRSRSWAPRSRTTPGPTSDQRTWTGCSAGRSLAAAPDVGRGE